MATFPTKKTEPTTLPTCSTMSPEGIENMSPEGIEKKLSDIEEGAGPEQEQILEDTFVATDPEKGLTTEQVEAAREKHGLNEIPTPDTPLYVIFLRQWVGFLPFLIEIAMIVALSVRDFVDFGIIAGIMLINALLGFREEYHAKKSLDEVSNSLDSEVAFRRNGETTNMSVKELVPGDIILLVGGTIVPADTKWISGDKMQIDTAAMTGEPIPRKYPSSEYGDIMFSGTTVVAGECYGQFYQYRNRKGTSRYLAG